MNLAEARSIAASHLERIQAECPVEIAFNDDVTEEHEIGYVYFYNSKRFWETRDFTQSLAGNGPLLVKKQSGDHVILPSHQSVRRSHRELESGKRP